MMSSFSWSVANIIYYLLSGVDSEMAGEGRETVVPPSYGENLESDGMKRWFPDILTQRDTPLTLLLEWLVGESVDLINCASAVCPHKPYLPVPAAHASEWVCAVVAEMQDAEASAGVLPGPELERVLYVHSQRLPRADDVERARSGNMITERAHYGQRPFALRIRTVTDFAPRSIGSLENGDIPAELSVFNKIYDYDNRMRNARMLAGVTVNWLNTLAGHYEAASGATDVESGDRNAALLLALDIVGNPRLVESCLGVYHAAVRQTFPSWSAVGIGIPFGKKDQWTMFGGASLTKQQIEFRQNVISRVRRYAASSAVDVARVASFAIEQEDVEEEEEEEDEDEDEDDEDDEDEEEPVKKRSHTANKKTNKKKKKHQPARKRAKTAAEQKNKKKKKDATAKPKFANALDIPGVERLIATKWKCDAENLATVVGPKFRELVLEIKRGTKGGLKVSRSRVLLPTHEYLQTITKALTGKSHMYGCGGDDDYDPVRNPDGCPPWVLVAVVVSACLAGLKHVLDNIRAVRENMEDSLRDAVSTKGLNYVSVAGEKLNFPQTFPDMFSKAMKDGSRIWNDLDAGQRDAIAIECLVCSLRGLTTLANCVARDTSMPRWLTFFVKEMASLFSAQEIDLNSICLAIREVTLQRAFQEFERPPSVPVMECPPPLPVPALPSSGILDPPTLPTLVPPPPPIPRVAAPRLMSPKRFVDLFLLSNEGGRDISTFFMRAAMIPPGLHPTAVLTILQRDEWRDQLTAPARNLAEGFEKLMKISMDKAECVARMMVTREGRDAIIAPPAPTQGGCMQKIRDAVCAYCIAGV